MSNKKEIAKIAKTLGEQSRELLEIKQLLCPHEDVEFTHEEYRCIDGYMVYTYFKKCKTCNKILQRWTHEEKQEWLKAQIEESPEEEK